MPFGLKPICTVCKSGISTLWRKGKQGEVLCNTCGLKQLGKFVDPGGSKATTNGNGTSTNGSTKSALNGKFQDQSAGTRKSSRIKPAKKPTSNKGKGRRTIFKKNPVRSCTSVSTIVSSTSIFYDGIYYQKGDIVSLVDHSRDVYYAQIRGFLTDQFSHKSVVLTWLLPTSRSPPSRFDISTYILGPEEDIPRKMEFVEFVCHCSSEYFRTTTAPYPVQSSKPELCYIWTSVGGEIKDKPSEDEIFGHTELLET